MQSDLKAIKVIKTKIIKNSLGDILLFLKKKQIRNKKWTFKEAYFSKIKKNKIKAWKMHLKMTLNLIVAYGEVKFIFYSEKKNKFKKIILNQKNIRRLVVPPGIWFGFKGLFKKDSIILNIANEYSEKKEVLKKNIKEIKYNWQ
jgi:dTDP-4-dehydrorhamnose 3,5-epimerase